MNFENINDFEIKSKIDKDIISRYLSKVPDELIHIWETNGLGSFSDGYFKTINPDIYNTLLQDSYFRGKDAIPIFVTSLAEIVTWEKGEYVGKVDYAHGDFNIIGKKFKIFLHNLSDADFLADCFDKKKYLDAVKKQGKLTYDECFGHVPLLALGGKNNSDSLQKCKIYEHIGLITSVIGKIGDD